MKLSMRITTNLMLEKENYRPKNIYLEYFALQLLLKKLQSEIFEIYIFWPIIFFF